MCDVIFHHTPTFSCGPPASEHPLSQCIWNHKNWRLNLMISFLNFPFRWERIVQEIDFLSPESSSWEGWESKSKDGTNVSFQWGCQDPFLVAVDRLVHESEGNKPIYNLQTFNLAVFYNELKHFFVQGNPNACWWSQNSYIPVPLTSASSPKKIRSKISILDSHYHPTTRRHW